MGPPSDPGRGWSAFGHPSRAFITSPHLSQVAQFTTTAATAFSRSSSKSSFAVVAMALLLRTPVSVILLLAIFAMAMAQPCIECSVSCCAVCVGVVRAGVTRQPRALERELTKSNTKQNQENRIKKTDFMGSFPGQQSVSCWATPRASTHSALTALSTHLLPTHLLPVLPPSPARSNATLTTAGATASALVLLSASTGAASPGSPQAPRSPKRHVTSPR